jgi:uncharacterized membrane protein HdeD (DUF308 family)
MEKQNEKVQENRMQDPMRQINRALGLFMSFFGVIVLVSAFYTETRIGSVTNLVAGSILTIIGIIMIFRRRKDSDTSQPNQDTFSK